MNSTLGSVVPLAMFFIMIHESKSNEERSHQHLTDFLPLVSLKLNNLN